MKTGNSLGIIAALLFAKAGVAGPAGTPHYPALVTLVPSDLGIEYNSVTGQKLLRFSNLTANLGEGPLEVIPVNNASNGTTDAYQVLYSHDADGNWYPVATNHVGTFVLHPAHNHW